MNYCIDPTADEPIMLIDSVIGIDPETGAGIDGSIFSRELLHLDTLGKKKIQVWINSPGGFVTEGYSIYSAILKTKTPVDTYCVGCAASIAGVIFQAGRKRIMADFSWLMYHNPFGGDDKSLEVMKESIVKMIEQRCEMTDEEVIDMMNRDTYILADEALKMKLCDEVTPSINENTKYLKKISNQALFHAECNKVLNSIITTEKTNTMEFAKVCMKLGLNDAAKEDQVLAAIESIENRAKKAEKQAEDAKKKLKEDDDTIDELTKALEKAKKEYEDCKAKLDAIKKDKKSFEEKAEEDKAKELVENMAKIGRIKNEELVKLDWLNTAKLVGYDKAKEILEKLPLNIKASVITNLEPQGIRGITDLNALPTTAVGLTVKNRLKREGKL
jgi:ATP-dependent Clp protease protease subunit